MDNFTITLSSGSSASLVAVFALAGLFLEVPERLFKDDLRESLGEPVTLDAELVRGRGGSISPGKTMLTRIDISKLQKLRKKN